MKEEKPKVFNEPRMRAMMERTEGCSRELVVPVQPAAVRRGPRATGKVRVGGARLLAAAARPRAPGVRYEAVRA